jgi:hypothetical protein
LRYDITKGWWVYITGDFTAWKKYLQNAVGIWNKKKTQELTDTAVGPVIVGVKTRLLC